MATFHSTHSFQPVPADFLADDGEHWSIGRKLRLIVGASLGLWFVLAGFVWLLGLV